MEIKIIQEKVEMLERRKKYGKLVKDVYAPKTHNKDKILHKSEIGESDNE